MPSRPAVLLSERYYGEPIWDAGHREHEGAGRPPSEIGLRTNVPYNGRRQRVLNGLSPEMVLRQRLDADPALANSTYKLPSPSLIEHALRSVEDAKEVSHPDN